MATSTDVPFRYIDLFAGIGGFAAALEAFGGECVYSVEIDASAAKVYERNWGHSPLGDITKDANDGAMNVPPHDLLAAGFPCQPFSKSGAQRGMEETRGTLFWNILKIIEAHHPTIVLLENVRNLAGPRHKHEWDLIIRTLRDEGYRVSSSPTVFSPHLLPLERGGRPQVRERVFITATYDPDGILEGVDPLPALSNRTQRGTEEWSLLHDLPVDGTSEDPGTRLTKAEVAWIDAWDDFVTTMWAEVQKTTADGRRLAALPGFPIWADHWVTSEELALWMVGGNSPYGTADVPNTWDAVPAWKKTFLLKNAEFYTRHKAQLDRWASRHDLASFPPSRRKLEWQAQHAATLWECVLQLRPSGIRAKRPTHVPALVAITQTSIIGPLRRRLTPREAARLQGFPDNFDFGPQRSAVTYKQLGNGVNIGAVWNVLRAHAERDAAILRSTERGHALLKALVDDAPKTPDDRLDAVVARGRARFADAKLALPV
ncbi:DNA cytosine methyltransferase [Cellulomonas shaoxiangyii]|uniref:Cytosine-specific methyltransferase n=1 Tax=Cellulomonas shaoxiangyii TaxID=2566013 RepID=A0A4P7SDS4_9CELL|nr:DNA cytosine methyltransferase [Cellulomonas shaoxiangyii]QCB92189.1 DNA cytosine methyltransferase [Cellulomonas shaoxiangyii]TGY86404.1 DNA cytosine methyltransferase [Cellulomonas shaoxiangyii]